MTLPDAFVVADSEVESEQQQIQPTPFISDAQTKNTSGVPRTLRRVREFHHGEFVCAVAIDSGNEKVYSGGKGCVKVWDMGQPVRESAKTPVATLECLNGNFVRSCKLFRDSSELIVGGKCGTVTVWDLQEQKIKAALDIGSDACYALSISPDQKLLYACCDDGKVILWDIHNATEVASLTGHSNVVSCVDISSDGLRLWTGSLDNTLRTWDLRERMQLSQYDYSSHILSVACCPDDQWVAVGQSNYQIEVLSTIRNEKYTLHKHEGWVQTLKFAHSGKWFLSTGRDNALYSWWTPCSAPLSHIKEPGAVIACDISHDDQYVVTGSRNKSASVYEIVYH